MRTVALLVIGAPIVSGLLFGTAEHMCMHYIYIYIYICVYIYIYIYMYGLYHDMIY